MEKSHKYLSIIFLVIGGISLIIYPFVLMANIMGFAAAGIEQNFSLLTFIVKAFILISTIYPLTYITSISLFMFKRKLWVAFLPIAHLVVCIMLLIFWAIGDFVLSSIYNF